MLRTRGVRCIRQAFEYFFVRWDEKQTPIIDIVKLIN